MEFTYVVISIKSFLPNVNKVSISILFINGVSKSFNDNVDAGKESDGGIDILGITGYSNSSTYNSEIFQFAIQYNTLGTLPVAGTYYSDSLSGYVVTASYFIPDPTVSFEPLYSQGSSYPYISDTSPFRIIITAIDSISLRGTFSGNLYYRDIQLNYSSVTVTDGDFYEKFK